jgi:hypothetical protein
VSRVTASAFDTATVYVSLNGYRWDDFNSYLYVSHNFGQAWEKIGAGIPTEPVNVVREDPANKKIIYAGTDNGLYVSINSGKNFMRMKNNLPNVAVHDLVIQPKAKEIVIGTHGRSLYKASVKELELLQDSILQKQLYVFDISSTKWNASWGKKDSYWEKPNEPKVVVPYFSKNNSITKFILQTTEGLVLNQTTDTSETGLNYCSVSLEVDSIASEKYFNSISSQKDFDKETKFEKAENGKYYLMPGNYTLKAQSGDAIVEKKIEVMKKKNASHANGDVEEEKE